MMNRPNRFQSITHILLATICLIIALSVAVMMMIGFWREGQVRAFEASIEVPFSDSPLSKVGVLLMSVAACTVICMTLAAWCWKKSKTRSAVSLMITAVMICALVVLSPRSVDFMDAVVLTVNGRQSPYRISEEQSPNKPNDVLSGHTPLHDAAKSGNITYLEYLIACGGDVNTEGREGSGETPMCVAHDRRMVDFLVSHGATLDELNSLGHTPLIALTYRNHIEAAKHLVSLGADVNKEDTVRQMNSLGWACAGQRREAFSKQRDAALQKRIELIRFLSQSGANLNDQDEKGRTPLHNMILEQNETLVLLLLELNADPAIDDHDGKQPLELAREIGLSSIVSRLEQSEN